MRATLLRTVRARTFVVAAILAVVAIAFLPLQFTSPRDERAVKVADRAAKTLGLALEEFAGPDVSSPGLLGSKTYTWQRVAGGTPVERLFYDPWEEHLCWSRVINGAWQHHGCVSTAVK
jgi:hypothetical protein